MELRKYKLYARAEKCDFLKKEVEYLGHVVSEEGIQVCRDKVAKVLDWPRPTTPKEVRSFLGIASFYRRFIEKFSHIARPLTDLTRQGANVSKWGQMHEAAFKRLKEKLCTAPVLQPPDFAKEFVVNTDASDIAVGAVLQQDFGRGLQPIAYESRKLSDAERRYSTYARELLAIVHACNTWRHYLRGRKFTLKTDHVSLRFFLKQPYFSARQGRWLEILQEFDMEIEHVPGWRNQVADALSRMTEIGRTRDALRELRKKNPDNVPEERVYALWEAGEILAGQRSIKRGYAIDEEALSLKRQLGKNEGNVTLGARTYKLQEGLIYSRANDSSQWQLFLPKGQCRLQALREMHDGLEGGHKGYQKTVELVTRRCWWRGVNADVRDYVLSCPECQRAKPEHRKPAGLLRPLEFPRDRWKHLSIDFITSLPTTAKGKDALMVVVDRMTKMVHLTSTTSTATAMDVARMFLRDVWRLHGVPRSVVSDRDTKFVSLFWKELMRLLGSRLRMSSAYHPQTDGQTEKTNDVVETTLRIFCEYRERTWDEFIPMVEFTINNSVSQATGFTPFYLANGYHPDSLIDLLYGKCETKLETLEQWTTRLQKEAEAAKAAVEYAQKRMLDTQNSSRRDEVFEPGDRVLLSLGKNKQVMITVPGEAEHRKFRSKFAGPFTVIERVSALAYRLNLPRHWRVHPVFHLDRLRRWRTSERQQRPAEQTPGPVNEETQEFEVDRILRTRVTHRGGHPRREFLVKWLGYNADDATWEPEGNLNCPRKLREFWDTVHSSEPVAQRTRRKPARSP